MPGRLMIRISDAKAKNTKGEVFCSLFSTGREACEVCDSVDGERHRQAPKVQSGPGIVRPPLASYLFRAIGDTNSHGWDFVSVTGCPDVAG
jgi:hypothetical protein